MKKSSSWIGIIRGDGSLKYFYFIYIVAFSLVAMITIFSQVIIQNYLGKQSEDSFLINIAGKQGMLSQKITKNLLLYADKEEDTLLQQTLLNDLNYWTEKQELLRSNNLIEPSYNTGFINKKYRTITPYFKAIQSNAYDFIETKNLDNLNAVISNEALYLDIMDDVVNEYDKIYQIKVNTLKKWELGLAGLLILLLIIEIAFIFIPLVKMLQKAVKNLLESERKSKKIARYLNVANDVLDLKNKEINDINLALDKVVLVIKTDPEGKIIYANDKYCELTKYSLTELKGKPLFHDNAGLGKNIIYDHLNDSKRKRNVWQGEIYDTASDQTEFWLDTTLFPIINKEDELYEYLIVCNDVTQRKNAEEEIKLVTEQRFLRQEEEQKIKSKSIIEGQERERKRMAIEVHDGLGQMLTALKFTCEAMDPKDEQSKEIQKNMKQLMQDIIVETRRISSDLLPTVLSDFGLIAAIKEMVANVNKLSDAKVVFYDKSIIDYRLSNEKEIAGYRITQEAINNALKHSNPSNVLVKLTSDAEYLCVSIEDDGTGIENHESGQERMNSGNGLRNMKERTRLIEGNIYINSSIDQGTQVFLEIPIN